jgi:hypothetical protein
MKWIIILAVLLIPAIAHTEQLCISSGQKPATTRHNLIATGSAELCGVIIKTDGTNNGVVIIYDKAATDCDSGTILFEMTVVGADYRGGTVFPIPIASQNGICMDITGTNAVAEVYYRP